LNDAGRADVAVCDVLGHDGKWRNLAKRQLADIVPPAQLAAWLAGRSKARAEALEQRAIWLAAIWRPRRDQPVDRLAAVGG
jgi:hypothetical protein